MGALRDSAHTSCSAHTNRFSRATRAKAAILCAIAPIAGVLIPARAGVQLTGVSNGTAAIYQAGAVTNIRTSNNAILNFSQFNIAAGSTVNFIQPSAASRELNRINSATPSLINGSIVSNGAVYMINPAGVIFGGGATIDVNKFVVAGSHMSDSDFLSGVDHFTGVSGLVSNAGTIRANNAILVGSQVVNTGSIVAPGGMVAMISGSDVLVSTPGSHVAATVVPAAATTPGNAPSSSTKDIRTSALAAGDPYSLAIRHTGSIDAASVYVNGGKGNVQISGSITARNGSTGGAVAITGGAVDLASANINASGPSGGGTVQIGGGPHGSGDLAHADYVSLDDQTTINADATQIGDGGSIALWSNVSTVSSATLTARGGLLGGNGGTIETSGESLQVNRAPNESAVNGVSGAWVLDPLDVEIINGPDNGTLTGSGTVTNGTIEAALATGNVTISTNQTGGNTGILSQDPNALITISLSIAETLTLQGQASIALHGGITNTGAALNVEIDAIGTSSIPVAIDTTPINTNGSLKILGGAITTSVSLSAVGVQMGNGNTTIGATPVVSDSININAPVNTGGGSFTALATTFTTAAAGSITDGGSGPGTHTLTINTTAGTGAVTLNGPITWAGVGGGADPVLINSKGAITIASTSSITQTNTVGTVPVSIYEEGNGLALTINGIINITGAFIGEGGSAFTLASQPAGTTALGATSVKINVDSNAPDGNPLTNGAVFLEGAVVTHGDVNLGGTTELTVNNNASITTNGGNINVSNTGQQIFGNPINTGGSLGTGGGNFTATAGTSFVTGQAGSITTGGGDVLIASTGTDGNQLSAEVNTQGGNFTMTGQAFTDEGLITDGGIVLAGKPLASVNINMTSNNGTGDINGVTVTWQGNTNNTQFRNVLVEGGGNVTINNVTATGSIPLPVSAFTTNANDTVSLSGPINITGAFLAAGGGFTVESIGSLNAASVSIGTVTQTPDTQTLTPGPTTISGPVTTSGAFLVQSSTTFTSSGTGSIATSGGALTIASTSDVSVGAPITTAGGAVGISSGHNFSSSGTGTITSSGGNVSIQGSNSASVDADVNTGGGNFAGSGGSFENSGTISDGGVNDSRAQGVAISTTSGAITINGPINWSSSFSPITFSVPAGQGVNLGSSITANAAEPVNFGSVPIALTGSATITGGNITLGALSDGTSGTNPSLLIQSAGQVSLQTIGTSSVSIGAIQVKGNGSITPTITLNGDIFVNGDAIFDGNVILPANRSITSAATDSNGTGDIEFSGKLQGPGGLTANSPVQIRFNGNVGDVTPLPFINLSTGATGLVLFSAGPVVLVTDSQGNESIKLPGTQQAPVEVDIASGGSFKINDVSPNPRNTGIIATSEAFGNVTINFGKDAAANSANTYAVGENDKFSVLGSLLINTNGGSIQTGDISTLNSLTLDANTITFMGRVATINSQTGAVLDTGMDLISGGPMTLPASAVYLINKGSSGVGNIDTPVFVAQSFTPGPNIPAITAELRSTFSIIGGIDPAIFFTTNNIMLDLTPATLSVTVPKFVPPIPFVYDQSIAGAAPREQLTAGTVPRDFKIAFETVYPGPVLDEDLKDNGIYTRDPDTDEILAAVGPMATYNDMPDMPRPHASDYKVVNNRFDYRRTQAYLKASSEIFGPNPEARRTKMTTDIQTAWDAYVTQNGDQPATGSGFARYCAATPSASAANNALHQLHSVRGKLADLGLSYKEAQVAFQYNILTGLSANGMRQGDLAAAVAATGESH